jgi:hypothetical protein
MKKKISTLLVWCALLLPCLESLAQATHGQDETVPSDIWPNTRYFEAGEFGYSNRLFIGGRSAAAPISWGAYPDNTTTGGGQYKYSYNGAPSARLLFANWSNGSFNIDFSDDANIISGNVVTWQNRLNLQQNGAMYLTGSLHINDINNNNNFYVDNTGNLWARQVKVTALAIPDYVFSKDYSLMNIPDLENYIKANKHLPNIPSAGDCEKNGNIIDVGQMQLKLLEKVEELTLYIIELDKKNKALETQFQSLKCKLAE